MKTAVEGGGTKVVSGMKNFNNRTLGNPFFPKDKTLKKPEMGYHKPRGLSTRLTIFTEKKRDLTLRHNIVTQNIQ